MSTPRAITLATIDHETVRLAEPSWCVGHAEHVPCHLVDLSHTGPEHTFAFAGSTLLVAMLTQDPFATDPDRCQVGLYVEQTGYAATLDFAGIRQYAAALTVHAMHLRTLADELAAINAGEAGR